mgnify:CR=1 FL=1
MTGKELITAAFRHEETPRLPWVPFAGVHAGLLKGYTATEVLMTSVPTRAHNILRAFMPPILRQAEGHRNHE